MPSSLETVAWGSLALGGFCACVIAFDLVRYSQHMWIMNIVWPVTALYSGPVGLYAYYRVGRLSSKEIVRQARERGANNPGKGKPFWQMVALGTSHCGAGCTLADLAVEWIMVFAPWPLFGSKLYGAWVMDYLWAYVLGIAFQYFTIAPMRQLSFLEGVVAALKADTLSLTAWQVGMFGWMACVTFVVFRRELHATDPVFWLMMQIGMLCGFVTSYPVNWFLLKAGWKEKM